MYPERLGAKIYMFNSKIECQRGEKGKIREQTKTIMRIWILGAKHEIYYFVHSTITYGISAMCQYVRHFLPMLSHLKIVWQKNLGKNSGLKGQYH